MSSALDLAGEMYATTSHTMDYVTSRYHFTPVRIRMKAAEYPRPHNVDRVPSKISKRHVSIGLRLIRDRTERTLTPTFVADACNMNVRRLRSIELGEADITLSELIDLANFYEKDIHEYL